MAVRSAPVAVGTGDEACEAAAGGGGGSSSPPGVHEHERSGGRDEQGEHDGPERDPAPRRVAAGRHRPVSVAGTICLVRSTSAAIASISSSTES